jgi:hypothetical protein
MPNSSRRWLSGCRHNEYVGLADQFVGRQDGQIYSTLHSDAVAWAHKGGKKLLNFCHEPRMDFFPESSTFQVGIHPGKWRWHGSHLTLCAITVATV